MAALLDMGFTASTQDPCLLYKDNFLVIMYMDDVSAAALSGDIIDNFVSELKPHGFKLTQEGTFSEYLGIKFEEDMDASTITLADTERFDSKSPDSYWND